MVRMGMIWLSHYDVKIDMIDGTERFERTSELPCRKIRDGHYVLEDDNFNVEMINMSRIAKITFTAVHHPE